MNIHKSYYETLYSRPVVALSGYCAKYDLPDFLYAYLAYGGTTGSAKDALAEGMLALIRICADDCRGSMGKDKKQHRAPPGSCRDGRGAVARRGKGRTRAAACGGRGCTRRTERWAAAALSLIHI